LNSRIERRRRAALGRIRKALDAFYLLQRIDWDYDLGASFDKILELALSEITLDDLSGGDKRIDRALLIIRTDEERYEAEAGWSESKQVDKYEFSRSIVDEVINSGCSILSQDAYTDDRFSKSQSVRDLSLASFVCIPILIHEEKVGAFLFASSSLECTLNQDDLEFLEEFVTVVTPYLKTALIHKVHLQTIQEKGKPDQESFHGLLGHSPKMIELFDQIRLMANTDATILIHGETGTGKTRIANAIHHASDRSDGPFITISCMSQPGHELEQQLFGEQVDSSPENSQDRSGAILQAEGGTLYLKDIGEMDISIQPRLLSFLQNRLIQPAGSRSNQLIDVRVIASTSQILKALVDQGSFREDLYYRLNVLPLAIPPLRERTEDIPLLTHHFLDKPTSEGQNRATEISPAALESLARRRWNGNVRELEHVIGRAALLSRSSILGVEDFAPEEVTDAPPLSAAEENFELPLEDVRKARGESGERDYIMRALSAVHKNASGRVDLVEKTVSKIRDCTAPTLRRRIKRLNIDLGEYVSKLSGKRHRTEDLPPQSEETGS
jgi:DNA-binding NtrC family response regulator